MTFRVPGHVHFRGVQDEVMLLDARDDAFFSLNPTGAVIWSVLAGGGEPEAAAGELVARFAVPIETARADVTTIVDEFVARGLLERPGR